MTAMEARPAAEGKRVVPALSGMRPAVGDVNFVESSAHSCLLMPAPTTSRYGREISGRVSIGGPTRSEVSDGDALADCAGRAIGCSNVL